MGQCLWAGSLGSVCYLYWKVSHKTSTSNQGQIVYHDTGLYSHVPSKIDPRFQHPARACYVHIRGNLQTGAGSLGLHSHPCSVRLVMRTLNSDIWALKDRHWVTFHKAAWMSGDAIQLSALQLLSAAVKNDLFQTLIVTRSRLWEGWTLFQTLNAPTYFRTSALRPRHQHCINDRLLSVSPRRHSLSTSWSEIINFLF